MYVTTFNSSIESRSYVTIALLACIEALSIVTWIVPQIVTWSLPFKTYSSVIVTRFLEIDDICKIARKALKQTIPWSLRGFWKSTKLWLDSLRAPSQSPASQPPGWALAGLWPVRAPSQSPANQPGWLAGLWQAYGHCQKSIKTNEKQRFLHLLGVPNTISDLKIA